MSSFKIDDYHVVVERKSKNKNTYLRLKNDGSIHVTCPYHIEDKIIISYIEQFIAKLKNKYNEDILNRLDYKNEGTFYYFNKKYTIKYIRSNKQYALLSSDYLNVYLKNENKENVKNVIDKFVKQEAEKYLIERFNELVKQFQHIDFIPQLKIKKMSSRFGVCYCKRELVILSTMLLHYSKECIDYVIIHELSHFIHFNHSKKFYYLVEQYVPNYKNIERSLKGLK